MKKKSKDKDRKRLYWKGYPIKRAMYRDRVIGYFMTVDTE